MPASTRFVPKRLQASEFYLEDIINPYEVDNANFEYIGLDNSKDKMFHDEKLNLFKCVHVYNNYSYRVSYFKLSEKNHKVYYRNDDGPTSVSNNVTDGLLLQWLTGIVNSGIQHRIGKPAIIGVESGYKCYLVNGVKHRFDGPAEMTKEWKRWFIDDTRIDGKYPVVEDDCLIFERPIDMGIILETTLFNREYGKYIKSLFEKCRANK